ncbi:MAG: hypothetical protein GVY04_17245 [Cyanobacteria bacterium]|nr:hypothetical protein [Cyanobacteria bacterium GSL.Bin1]
MTQTTISKNGVTIRLPEERWEHITQRHQGLNNQKEFVLKTIADPERILDANEGALMAVRTLAQAKVLVVVYREIDDNDGFIITAFPTRRFNSLNKRRQIWP